MNPTEVAALLTVISSYDRRSIADADVHAWHAALHNVGYDAARDAVVKHYATETVWLMPAHVRKLATAAGNDRAARTALETPRAGDGRVTRPDWFGEVMSSHRTNAADRWQQVWGTKPQRTARGVLRFNEARLP